GGTLKIVNRMVPEALQRLGYSPGAIAQIVDHIDRHDTIEDVDQEGRTIPSGLQPQHLPVFDCAFVPSKGKRSIGYLAHLRMMAAAQPFISGAISKTVNLPRESTVEDIQDTYVQAWKMGLKCVAIYRDGSKRSQPLNTRAASDTTAIAPAAETAARIQQLESVLAQLQEKVGKPIRRRLPETRRAITHKFEIARHEGYLTVGLFENGQPGEIFITMAKEGSTIAGLMDCVATLTSMSLQYGVPLEDLVRKFAHQRFEPFGFTRNPDIHNASSIIDYVFRWLAFQFIPGYREANTPTTQQPDLAIPGLQEEMKKNVNRSVPDLPLAEENEEVIDLPPQPNTPALSLSSTHTADDPAARFQLDAPICPTCGRITVRCGACYRCLNCGDSLGCS
ncbi:MAG: vitamin B12-dependent ribonucleotide reductase, partial [Verrucomicrobia bacterium]|nr:vitamin B12-dependent ribonucleotide reductase [Verrucomicrobiota bacterium]